MFLYHIYASKISIISNTFWTSVFENIQSPLSYLSKTKVLCVSVVAADVSIEAFTLARSGGLSCCSHVTVQLSPTLETNQCHAIAEKNRPENR